MKTQSKFALVTIPIAIVAFLLTFQIWPNPAGMAMPDNTLLPYFIIVSALECVAFGVGVAFAIFSWQRLQMDADRGWLPTAAYISIIWLLVSWWPHDNMHRVNGMENFVGLLRIEYMFHVTLIIAGCVVAAYLWRQLSGGKHMTPMF